MALPEFVTPVIAVVGTPALIGAVGKTYLNVYRARLLKRAGETALEKGCKDPQGKAGLEIVDKLTRDEPWYSAILPWRKSGDDQSGP